MPAPYATPSNVTDFVDMFSYMNNIGTPGMFGALALLAIFSITYLLNANKEVEVAFAISSWITCVSAIFLSMIQGSFGYLIPGAYVSATVVLAAVAVIIMYMRR